MSLKPETVFYTSVHKHLPPAVELHREKMNNPYSSGTPDFWFSGSRTDLWIEYKFLQRIPVKAPIVVAKLLSRLQLDWLQKRSKEGRNVAVIVGCSTGGVFLQAEDWSKEISGDRFKALILSRKELAEHIVRQIT